MRILGLTRNAAFVEFVCPSHYYAQLPAIFSLTEYSMQPAQERNVSYWNTLIVSGNTFDAFDDDYWMSFINKAYKAPEGFDMLSSLLEHVVV
jgi:hypothetical protein